MVGNEGLGAARCCRRVEGLPAPGGPSLVGVLEVGVGGGDWGDWFELSSGDAVASPGVVGTGTGTVLSLEITSVFPLGCLIVTVVSVSFVTGNGPSATGASLCARSSLSWYSFRTNTWPPTSGVARTRRRRLSKFFLYKACFRLR